MRIVSQAIFSIGLLTIGIACCGCGNDGPAPASGGQALTDQQKTAAAAKAGVAPNKAQGGVTPPPLPPQPGEHVGLPPSGGKTGGG